VPVACVFRARIAEADPEFHLCSPHARRVRYSCDRGLRQPIGSLMRAFTLRGLTLYLPEEALKGNLERALTSGRYENHEADALLLHLRPGDRLIDLGAGLGFICALAAGVLGEDAVMGVEAGPETVKLARRNLAANGFEGVKVMKGAVVGSAEGEVEFGKRPAFWASALKGSEGWPENADVIRVPARPIGKLLAKFAPTVISCDIEGGELEVLTQPLPGVRLVVVETHPQVYGPEGVAQIGAALAAQGFEPAEGAKKDTLVFRRDLKANGGPEGPPRCRNRHAPLGGGGFFFHSSEASRSGHVRDDEVAGDGRLGPGRQFHVRHVDDGADLELR